MKKILFITLISIISQQYVYGQVEIKSPTSHTNCFMLISEEQQGDALLKIQKLLKFDEKNKLAQLFTETTTIANQNNKNSNKIYPTFNYQNYGTIEISKNTLTFRDDFGEGDLKFSIEKNKDNKIIQLIELSNNVEWQSETCNHPLGENKIIGF